MCNIQQYNGTCNYEKNKVSERKRERERGYVLVR